MGKQADSVRVQDIVKIHNVFHVSPMEPCGQEGDEAEQLQAIEVDDEEFEVEEILESRLHYGQPTMTGEVDKLP